MTAQRVPGRTFCDCCGRHTGLTSGDEENGRSSFSRATSKSNVVGSKFGCNITLLSMEITKKVARRMLHVNYNDMQNES